MSLLKACLTAVVLTIFFAGPAYCGGNFAFAVKGEPGLEVIVTGYARDGTQIFRQETNLLERCGDASCYIVRVDENIVRNNTLGEWCVQELTGKWDQLPKDGAEVAVCDNRPSETRGTYVFQSRRQRNVESVAVNKPDENPYDVLVVGKGVTKRQERAIRQGLLHARDFLKSRVGVTISAPVRVFASTDAKWLTDNYLKEKKLGERYRAGKIKEFGCSDLSAEGGYHVIFLCMSSNAWKRGDSSGGNVDAGNMFIVMHEYTHNMQFDLVGERGKKCCTDNNAMSVFGPQWLVEGSAEYMAFALMGELGHINLDQHMLGLTGNFRGSDFSLAKRETRKGFREKPNSWDIGPVATHLLVSKAGFEALARFWTEIGKGIKMRIAFSSAFGRSTEEFDREFAEYVKNPSAAAKPQVSGEKTTTKAPIPAAKAEASELYEFEISIDKNASFEVTAVKGNTVLWKSGNMGAKTNLFIARIPRSRTKNATKFCVILAKGWIVRDRAGKAYGASCGDFGSLALPGFGYELNVEKQ